MVLTGKRRREEKRRRGEEDRGLCASVELKKCRGRQNKKKNR